MKISKRLFHKSEFFALALVKFSDCLQAAAGHARKKMKRRILKLVMKNI